MLSRGWAATRWFVLAASLSALACVSTPITWDHPTDFDSAALWPLHWQKDFDAYRSHLEEAAWEQSGSIEAERYRQSYFIQRGHRVKEYLRADERAKQFPNDPDAQYLRARLLQDPVRLKGEFQKLAQRWPKHAWIQLGAAGSLQNIGRYREAAAHLNAAPDWPDAREFRMLVSARQALAFNHSEPWLPLMQLAFEQGNPDALYEVQQLAIQKQNAQLQQLCRSEIELRQGVGKEEGQRLQRLLNRALAEMQSERVADVAELLAKMDHWAELLQLPTGWSDAKRYRLPGGLGMLVPPETQAAEWSQLLDRHQTALMIGESVTTEPAMLVLYDVERHQLTWPGLEQPIEVVLAESGESNQQTYFAGAALFRGFYARRDLSDALAAGISSQLQRVFDEGGRLEQLSTKLGPSKTQSMDRGNQDVGRLPEDLDLSLRIRLHSTREGAQEGSEALRKQVEVLEWKQLLLHEAGHLPDVLPWTKNDGNLWSALAMGIRSLMRDGMLLGEWEYRAQLRALVHSDAPGWAFAEIVEIARTPQHPYHKPYRRLLADLWRIGQQQQMPDLPDWIRLDAEITRVGEKLMMEHGMKPMPRAFLKQLKSIE